MYEGKANLTLISTYFTEGDHRLEDVRVKINFPPSEMSIGADGTAARVKRAGELTVDVGSLAKWNAVEVIEVELATEIGAPRFYEVTRSFAEPSIDGTVATYPIK